MNALTVGGATVSIRDGRRRAVWAVDKFYRPFFRPGGSPALALSLHPLDAWSPEGGSVCFDSGLAWRVTQTPGSWSFEFSGDEDAGSRALYRALSIDRSWRSGRLYWREPRPARLPRRFPLDYPVAPLLFVTLLSRSAGAVVHATGMIRDGRGWVFAGAHGAGKSTLAALFRRRRGLTLLNDDRVVVRCVEGQWRVFSTPWPGTVQRVSPESAALGGVFFLRHAATTGALPLPPRQSAQRLLARCFHPYWDRDGLEGLLGTIERLVREVPCYDFPFAPHLPSVLAALAALQP